jgi:hypothetical protein
MIIVWRLRLLACYGTGAMYGVRSMYTVSTLFALGLIISFHFFFVGMIIAERGV